MKNKTYTYNESLAIIKKHIAKKKPNLTRKLEHGDIAEFCKKQNLEYFSIVNCLNSKKETHPVLVKELLTIVLKKKNISHIKQNIYIIEND